MALHAIAIPFPAQGHLTPMMQLALHLLRREGGFTHITLINTEYNHARIMSNGQSQHLQEIPGLKLCSIPDGLPADHGRLNDGRIEQFAESIDAMHEPMHKMVEHIVIEASNSLSVPSVSCIISDSYFYWMADVADAFSFPWVAFWTIPAHASLAYCSISELLAEGIVPVNCESSESKQRTVECIPGVPALKAAELPAFLHTRDGSADGFFFQWCLKRFRRGVPQRARWHLGNTAEGLGKVAADAFEECMGGKYWTVGPLLPADFFKGHMDTAPADGTSLWREEGGCKQWLDQQQARSVLYISFGSIVRMPPRQVEEVAAGLEASGYPFLWVLRSDVDAATLEKLQGFKERTKSRGVVVSWAPQWLLLSHTSVAAFLTHCGWNSILEAMSGGVPMLAWPGGFSEQTMNAKYIIDVWEIAIGFAPQPLVEEGLLIVMRKEIQRVISIAMSPSSHHGKALKERALHIQDMLRDAILSSQGSSHANLNAFLEALTPRGPLTPTLRSPVSLVETKNNVGKPHEER